jgi:tRNA U34 5-methylaminomethyl-2-thiouridine-forming methyltransferase MnmC
MKHKLIETKDGSHTLYLPDLDEQYHSLNGAITESQHIYINTGFLGLKSNDKTVLEIGFGTGLNCLLTALEAQKRGIKTKYITIEKYPLGPAVINQLNYTEYLGQSTSPLFKKIHDVAWEKEINISDHFDLLKLNLDITSGSLPENITADVIYFDAFGPDKQPEMWEGKVIKKVTDLLNPGGILVTYSVKGSIKRCLQSQGFKIEKLPGPPGKKEILRGIKI